MSINTSSKDIIWNILGTSFSMAANLFLLPVVIYFLDADMLGLWYVYTSVGAIAQLFDFGFSTTFSRNVSYSWSGATSIVKSGVRHVENEDIGPNYELLNTILKCCKILYLLISSIVLIFTLLIGTPYILYISNHIADKTYIIAWFIYTIATYFNLYYGYYSPFLRGVGGITQANKSIIIARLLQIATTIVLLFSGFGLIGACTAYLVYGLTFRALGKYFFYKYDNLGEHLKSILTQPTKHDIFRLFNTIWYSAWRDGLVSLSNYLCSQASTIICSLFMTLAITGSYSLGLQVATAITTISTAYYSALYPKLQSAYIRNERDTVLSIISKVICVYTIVFIVCTILATIIALPFLAYIRPGSTVSSELYILISIAQFIIGYRNIFTTYLACTNRIIYTRTFVAASILCVLLQVLFSGVFKIGPYGLVFAQIISQLIFNAWYWPIHVHKELNLSPAAVLRYFGRYCRDIFVNRTRRL